MWVFDTVGLTVFIGVVGLGAGPSFVSGLQKSGVSLILVGLVVAVLPHTLAILFGRYVLRMNPLILLGVCSGAGTVTAALRGAPGGVAEQAARAGLHRPVCRRQHPADRVGAGHRGVDAVTDERRR